MTNSKYVDIIYNTRDRPFNDYPDKLINHLISIYELKKNSKLLEIGCGRGDFLKAFVESGMKCHGVDISDSAKEICPEANIETINLLNDKLPYPDNCFDIVYSKSVVEHFYYPEKIFEEAYRVLKPSGILITLTPEWEYIYKSFYEDFSHRTPFTKDSLRDIQKLTNFKDIKVESFKQLPILWEKNKLKLNFFRILSFLTRVIVPDFFQKKTKWIRFSKEIMLISSSYK
jgi:ubiquinone/menaquinone biosynthesis C-methylase UbiE